MLLSFRLIVHSVGIVYIHKKKHSFIVKRRKPAKKKTIFYIEPGFFLNSFLEVNYCFYFLAWWSHSIVFFYYFVNVPGMGVAIIVNLAGFQIA